MNKFKAFWGKSKFNKIVVIIIGLFILSFIFHVFDNNEKIANSNIQITNTPEPMSQTQKDLQAQIDETKKRIKIRMDIASGKITPTPTLTPTPTYIPKPTSAPTRIIQTPTNPPAPQTNNQNTSPISSETISQRNAVAKARSYLGYSAFSHDGLVAQLEYEQFSNADAVYGADNSGGNWNDQAAKKAKSYMDMSAFSRGSLIEQLKYEKFTQEQAEYGASAVGL